LVLRAVETFVVADAVAIAFTVKKTPSIKDNI